MRRLMLIVTALLIADSGARAQPAPRSPTESLPQSAVLSTPDWELSDRARSRRAHRHRVRRARDFSFGQWLSSLKIGTAPSRRSRRAVAWGGFGSVAGSPARAARSEGGCFGQRVTAAYYSSGRRTASGQAFNPNGMTAAHRSMPFGSRVRVTNPRTGASVSVTINDRGPFVRGIHIDLSAGAARAIGMRGTQTVCIS